MPSNRRDSQRHLFRHKRDRVILTGRYLDTSDCDQLRANKTHSNWDEWKRRIDWKQSLKSMGDMCRDGYIRAGGDGGVDQDAFLDEFERCCETHMPPREPLTPSNAPKRQLPPRPNKEDESPSTPIRNIRSLHM